MDFITSEGKIFFALYNADESLYLSEISRITNKSKSLVLRKLLELVRKDIVIQKNRGPKRIFYTLHPYVRKKLEYLESSLKNKKLRCFSEMVIYIEEMGKEITKGA